MHTTAFGPVFPISPLTAVFTAVQSAIQPSADESLEIEISADILPGTVALTSSSASSSASAASRPASALRTVALYTTSTPATPSKQSDDSFSSESSTTALNTNDTMSTATLGGYVGPSLPLTILTAIIVTPVLAAMAVAVGVCCIGMSVIRSRAQRHLATRPSSSPASLARHSIDVLEIGPQLGDNAADERVKRRTLRATLSIAAPNVTVDSPLLGSRTEGHVGDVAGQSQELQADRASSEPRMAGEDFDERLWMAGAIRSPEKLSEAGTIGRERREEIGEIIEIVNGRPPETVIFKRERVPWVAPVHEGPSRGQHSDNIYEPVYSSDKGSLYQGVEDSEEEEQSCEVRHDEGGRTGGDDEKETESRRGPTADQERAADPTRRLSLPRFSTLTMSPSP
ncbi:hypothetical protein LTR66_001958 [Elasticomyces elasticus]|nr:hypothetical protein LTR66_001958 [Elasticomyces elasticus]